jgi:hypothetical protein
MSTAPTRHRNEPFEVRWTWKPSNGVVYPEHTYRGVSDRDEAIMRAQQIATSESSESLRLVAVHWRDVTTNIWHPLPSSTLPDRQPAEVIFSVPCGPVKSLDGDED